MDENSVMNEQLTTTEPTEVEGVSGPVDEGQEEVSIAELLGIKQDVPAEMVDEPAKAEPAVDAPAQEDGQDKVGKAFAAERRRVEAAARQRYEEQLASDPARVAGQRLLEDIARSHNLTMEQAAALAEESFYRAVAERENVSPAVARAIFRQEQPQRQTNQEQQAEPQAVAARIRGEVAALKQSGGIPQGFDFDKSVADESFIQLLTEMPTAAAIRVYHAENKANSAPQDMAEKLRARQQIPQSERPQQPVDPKVDYNSLSDEQMLELNSKRKEMRLRGIKVKI